MAFVIRNHTVHSWGCSQRLSVFDFLSFMDLKVETLGGLENQNQGRAEVEFAEHGALRHIYGRGEGLVKVNSVLVFVVSVGFQILKKRREMIIMSLKNLKKNDTG